MISKKRVIINWQGHYHLSLFFIRLKTKIK